MRASRSAWSWPPAMPDRYCGDLADSLDNLGDVLAARPEVRCGGAAQRNRRSACDITLNTIMEVTAARTVRTWRSIASNMRRKPLSNTYQRRSAAFRAAVLKTAMGRELQRTELTWTQRGILSQLTIESPPTIVQLTTDKP